MMQGAAKKRGRPAKSKPAEMTNHLTQVAGSSTVGHNSTLTDDQQKALTFSMLPEYRQLIENKKSATNALLNFGRRAKADLGKFGVMRLKIALDDEENENAAQNLRDKLEAQIQMARWLGMPLAIQGDLFGVDRRSAEDRAEEEGYKSGSDKTTQFDIPDHYSGPTGQAFAKGFHRAQKELSEAFEKQGNPLLRSVASIGEDVPENDNEEEGEDVF